jgi:uncharacterized protein DUF928
MRINRVVAAGLLAPTLLVASVSSAPAQQSDGRPAPAPAMENKAGASGSGQAGLQPSGLVYRPPLRGAPGGRVGGGSRGGGAVSVTALVPEGRALTSLEQPSLSWYLSGSTPAPVEVTISDDRSVKPVLEVRLPQPVQPGVQRIRLADHGVKLEPGVQYKWFVTVVVDPARRSRDVLAGGTIERVEPSGELSARLASARPETLPMIYAEAGLWYDALGAIADLLDRTPNDQTARDDRAQLLSQAGLPKVE